MTALELATKELAEKIFISAMGNATNLDTLTDDQLKKVVAVVKQECFRSAKMWFKT